MGATIYSALVVSSVIFYETLFSAVISHSEHHRRGTIVFSLRAKIGFRLRAGIFRLEKFLSRYRWPSLAAAEVSTQFVTGTGQKTQSASRRRKSNQRLAAGRWKAAG